MIFDCPDCGKVYSPSAKKPETCPACGQPTDIRKIAEREIARLRKITVVQFGDGCRYSTLATSSEGRELLGWLPLERDWWGDYKRVRVKLTERVRLDLDRMGGLSGEILRRYVDEEFYCDHGGQADFYWVTPVGEPDGVAIKVTGPFLEQVFERLEDV